MNATPILTPVLALLRSRKFIVGVVALLINLLIVAIPNLEAFRDQLMAVVTGLALALIGGIAYEDAAQAGKDATVVAPVTPEESARKLLLDIIDATFGEQQVVNKVDVKIAVMERTSVPGAQGFTPRA